MKKTYKECLACPIRIELLDLSWILSSQTTAANVHRIAPKRCLIVGCLELCQLGAGRCDRCLCAIDNVHEVTR